MNFAFHPEAEVEFSRAIEYYEDIAPGLGYDFSIEVHASIQRSIAMPGMWPVIDDDIRRSLVKRFPYAVLYSVENDRIFILAVMNLHRHPDYWKERR